MRLAAAPDALVAIDDPSGIRAKEQFMTPEERTAIHQKQADGWYEAARVFDKTGRASLPPEFVIAEDCTITSPVIGYGEVFGFGKALADSGLSLADVISVELASYRHKIPDFNVGDSRILVAPEGWALWFRLEGTTPDGQAFGFTEADFIQTNEKCEIVGWECFLDWSEYGPVYQYVTGNERPKTWADHMAGIFAFLPEIGNGVSAETLANLKAAGLI